MFLSCLPSLTAFFLIPFSHLQSFNYSISHRLLPFHHVYFKPSLPFPNCNTVLTIISSVCNYHFVPLFEFYPSVCVCCICLSFCQSVSLILSVCLYLSLILSVCLYLSLLLSVYVIHSFVFWSFIVILVTEFISSCPTVSY